MEPSKTSFFQLPKPSKQVIITVQLDDGTIVQRDPSQLVALPANLVVPIASLVNS